MPVAITVVKGTLTSSGSRAMCTTVAADVRGVEGRLRPDRAIGLPGAGGDARGHLGRRVADVDLPHGDPVRAAVEGHGPGQPGDRVLGGGVGDAARPRDMCRDRAVVDDPSAGWVLRLHQPDGGAGAEEHPGEVDLDGGPPVGDGDVVDLAGRAERAGVVDQQVQPAPGVAHRGEGLVDVPLVGDVGGQNEDGAAGSRRPLQRGAGAAEQRDRPPVVGQGPGDGAAQPGAGAGDHGGAGRLGHERSLPRARGRRGRAGCTPSSTCRPAASTPPVRSGGR